MKRLQVGNAQAFWGDQIDAPSRLVKQHPSLDYLTLDYLSEVSMSILAVQKEKDPIKGYAQDFLGVIRSLIPFWKKGGQVKVISNAGGLNPQGCAQACSEILKKEGFNLKIGVVSGDDVLHQIRTDLGSSVFRNLENGASIQTVAKELTTANAYLGAPPIAEALQLGAQIVITGRVADPSLTVGPCLAHFGWKDHEYQKIAGATVAGHLIECGTQVTGGISTKWLEITDPANIGFPIAEIEESGECILTKPAGTSGKVNEQVVKEQLLYEIGDPQKYLSPDATVSFLGLTVKEVEKDRVKVAGAIGSAPPPTYKVSATYRDGFKCEAMLTIFGREAYKKGQLCGQIILERVRQAGFVLQRHHIECLGLGDLIPGVLKKIDQNDQAASECVMRIAVADPREEALERFSKEIASLVTSGPQGVTGYVSGRPPVRKVFGYWPCLIDVGQVKSKVEIL